MAGRRIVNGSVLLTVFTLTATPAPSRRRRAHRSAHPLELARRSADEALKVLEIVKAKDADRLFQAGSDIDRACEGCHLEYWYPGDSAAVLRDRNSRVYTTPAAKTTAEKR